MKENKPYNWRVLKSEKDKRIKEDQIDQVSKAIISYILQNNRVS